MEKEEIIIGTKVIYWAYIKSDGKKIGKFETEISSNAWLNGNGVMVCHVRGKSGPGVPIINLEKIK